MSFIYLVRRALGNERPWKTECGDVARVVRKGKTEKGREVYVCVSVRDGESAGSSETSPSNGLLPKIAQARISVGNINLNMMSVIKLRTG